MVWAKRYLEAYRFAAGLGPTPLLLGKVEFKKLNGDDVTLADLGGEKETPTEQADAVRDYLKRHGGQLIIEINDKPGLGTTAAPPFDRERLLLFNVGVEGSSMRYKAEQYLHIGSTTPQGNWRREFSNGSWRRAKLVRPAGLTSAQPPQIVSMPSPPIFSEGECW
jgi:hypothetical protein